jgi:hypothetical protein
MHTQWYLYIQRVALLFAKIIPRDICAPAQASANHLALPILFYCYTLHTIPGELHDVLCGGFLLKLTVGRKT